MLFLEDFKERTFIENILKKTGYDVLTVASSHGIANEILGFSPDVLMVSLELKNESLADFLAKVKKNKGKPKILVSGKERPDQEQLKSMRVNAFITSPIKPRVFFNMLEKFGGFNAVQTLLKLHKAKLIELDDEDEMLIEARKDELDGDNLVSSPEIVRGAEPRIENIQWDSMPPEDRKQRYDMILDMYETPDVSTSFDAKTIDAFVEEIEKDYTDADKARDEKRKEFVKKIFQKAKENKG